MCFKGREKKKISPVSQGQLPGYRHLLLPGGSDSKASVYNEGDLGSIPGSGRFPWRRKWQSTPVLLPGKSHGQRSLVGYSPLGGKESDMTEQLHSFIHSFKTPILSLSAGRF